MRTLLRAFAVVLTLTALGCPLEEKAPPPAPPAPPAADAKAGPVPKPAADAPVYDVMCGCTLPEVKKCGPWAATAEGKHVLITDLGMGKMPFCGKKDLKARIAGEVKDGELHATGFEYLE
jgi:hypothetical protein